MPLELRSLIMKEYDDILLSLVEADKLFHETIKVKDGKF